MESNFKVSKDHYIPQFLLKNFAHKKGDYHLLQADTSSGEIRKEGIEDSFQRLGLNYRSKLDENSQRTGELDNTVEKLLSKAESKAATVIRKMVRAKNPQKVIEVIDTDEQAKKDLIYFLHLQFLRNPYLIYHTQNLLGENDFAKSTKLWMDGNVLIPNMHGDTARNVFLDEKIFECMREEIEQQHITAACIDKRAASAGSAFITGDVGLALICNRNHSMVWLPISPQIALRIDPDDCNKVIQPCPELVKSINRYIFEGSETLVVQSEEHFREITSLRKLEYEKSHGGPCFAYQYQN